MLIFFSSEKCSGLNITPLEVQVRSSSRFALLPPPPFSVFSVFLISPGCSMGSARASDSNLEISVTYLTSTK